MKKRRFTIEQIIQILTEGEKGNGTVAASVCRKYGIAPATYYRWKREYKDSSRAIRLNGKPDIIRSDNGPEFRSKLLNSFLNTNRIKHEFIKKGKLYQKGITESFIDKLRDKCPNLNAFKNIEEAKEIIGNYIDFYNRKRPRGSLNYKTPVEFERSLATMGLSRYSH